MFMRVLKMKKVISSMLSKNHELRYYTGYGTMTAEVQT